MKTVTLVYEFEEQLKDFIEYHKIKDSSSVLLQVFTGHCDKSYIKRLLKNILKQLPSIKIIGTTTAGEISQSGRLLHSTVLSFSIFTKTKIKTKIEDFQNDSFELGYSLIKSFGKDNFNELKLAISFSDGLNVNGEEYLKGLSSFKEDIIIAGGLAGDNYKFEESFVFNESGITNKGAVVALLYNKDLNVFTNYNFNWKAIGKKHIVEKSHKNRVFKIDGKTALEFYKYYLGEDVSRLLPGLGIEFPLIIQRDGMDIARVITGKDSEDESLVFAGNVEEGSEVRIGYGNIELILNKTIENVKSINNKSIESLFIYSCSARQELLNENINLEILPFAKIASVSGFFSYGEFFFNKQKNQFLNQTMTILGLSEDERIKVQVDEDKLEKYTLKEEKLFDFYKTQGLSHIINQTTKELEELNNTLEQRVEIEVKKSLAKDKIVEKNIRHAKMGEVIDMIIHQLRQPLNAFSTGLGSLKFYKENNMLSDEAFSNLIEQLLKSVSFLNITIDDFRNYFTDSSKTESLTPKELVQRTYMLIKSLLNKKAIVLNENYAYYENITVPVSKMMQVILNILNNAIDAIDENCIEEGTITISSKKDGNYCVIEIEDNAGGISIDNIQKIFDKRFTTKENTHGTGIGLSMSKEIIQNDIKGTLEVENTASGALFSIRIPIS